VPLVAPSLTVADAQNAGGFTATLTGGDPASVNTLYRSQMTGNVGVMAQTSAGSRTGPGTITGTAAVGFYVWQVQSVLAGEQSWSSPYYQRVSNSADSLHEQLQQDAEARIKSLALPTIGDKVRRLKLPAGARNVDLPSPACILLTFDQEEDYRATGTNGHDDTSLPLHVVILTGDLNTPKPDSTITICRQLVRRAFREYRSSVPGHYRTDIERGIVLAQAAEGKSLEGSSLLLKFYVRESRGLGV
jgi:hypothetical protein